MGFENTFLPLFTVFGAMIVAGLAVKFIKGGRDTRLRILVYFPILAALVFLGLQWVIAKPMAAQRQLARAANDLCKFGESQSIQQLGSDLKAKLNSIRSNGAAVAKIRLGDVPSPRGDGTAAAHLTITNGVGQSLGIRLRYATGGRFEPIGYWSEDRADGGPSRQAREKD